MAGDWIKMRTDLYRDPKTIMISDFLMDSASPLAAYVNQNMQQDMVVTRNVTRNVTVGALVSVWGTVRNRGKRVGDDLHLDGCNACVVDDIADMPGFGDAMIRVGWLRKTPQGLVFPRFYVHHNVDPKEKYNKKNRERQRRFRESKSNVTRNVTDNVTVTHRVEKSREEKKKEKKTKEKRVCFKKPTIPEIKMYCLERKNKVDPESFFDFYESKGWKVGANQMKDWHAAIRTWEKRETQDSQSKATKSRVPTAEDLKHYNPHSPTGLDPGYIPEELR